MQAQVAEPATQAQQVLTEIQVQQVMQAPAVVLATLVMRVPQQMLKTQTHQLL
jgi:hypothetical protein